MNGVLSKPLNLPELQAVLALWIDEDIGPGALPEPESLPEDLWQVFLDCNEADYQQAAQAVAQQDYPDAVLHIHRILGAARVMQVHDLASLADSLEQDLLTQPANAEAGLLSLRTALDHLQKPEA